jgi:nitrate/nitrite transport system ATP-binding protein
LLRLCERTNKTVVMVTHDVDEALLLADRIVMMTNGPAATIGGILPVTLPRPRTRAVVLDHPAYYPARDHLLRFLESGIPPPEDEKGDEDEEVNRTTAVHAR